MRVDVIVPVRNAAALLPDCIAAIRGQTLQPGCIHIAVGPSADDTERLVTRLAALEPAIRVYQNPAGDRGSGLNVVLDRLEPDVEAVAMVDAQSRLAPDYLEQAVHVLNATGAAVVGGPMRPAADGIVGGAIAAALSSRAGVGDSAFHFQDAAGEAASVYLGVYRWSVLDAVGRYDPRLLRTEDDDINARIRAAGGRIWLDPSIRSTYLGRRTLTALFRQYHGYGHSKVALVVVRPEALRPRHLAPAALVAGFVLSALASIVAWRPALPFAMGTYAAGLLGVGLLACGRSFRVRLVMPLALAAMHLGYGIGSWTAILQGRWRR